MNLFGRRRREGAPGSSQASKVAWGWVRPTFRWCLGGLWQVRRTIVLATAVYTLVLLLALPFICTDLPYCKLYQSRPDDFSNALGYNDRRVLRADEYIQSLPEADTKMRYERHKQACCPRFAIGVITTRRGSSSRYSRASQNKRSPEPRYLTQVMAQLHHAIEAENATSRTALFMCNVDAYHDLHVEFHNLTRLFSHQSKYEDDTFHSFLGTNEKEKVDYKYCLREALKYNPEYVILLQDDALPQPGFLSILEHILTTRIEQPIRAGDFVPPRDDWLWLKLNFPDNLAFFERNWYFALEWVALTMFISGCFTLLLHISHLCRSDERVSDSTDDTTDYTFDSHGASHSRRRSGYYTTGWLYLVFVLSFALVFLVLLLLGRPYFTKWRSISKYLYTLGPGTSCCLPAVLYPARQVPYIVGYLQHIKCHPMNPLDIALDEYRIRRGLRQYLISPNLFRHIGMYSSLRHMYNFREASKYLFLE